MEDVLSAVFPYHQWLICLVLLYPSFACSLVPPCDHFESKRLFRGVGGGRGGGSHLPVIIASYMTLYM